MELFPLATTCSPLTAGPDSPCGDVRAGRCCRSGCRKCRSWRRKCRMKRCRGRGRARGREARAPWRHAAAPRPGRWPRRPPPPSSLEQGQGRASAEEFDKVYQGEGTLEETNCEFTNFTKNLREFSKVPSETFFARGTFVNSRDLCLKCTKIDSLGFTLMQRQFLFFSLKILQAEKE